jgi:transcriptional regulator with XRE-family HTH domain
MDDRRIGMIVRTLRRRRGWRQLDLAAASGLSQSLISLIERGHVEQVALRTIRRVLLSVEARAEVEIRWRGGELDRLLDERHALLVGAIVEELRGFGWSTAVEVTYSRFGERGWIDVLGYRRDRSALLIGEAKSELASIEETLRRIDQKVRLGPSVAAERLGWAARSSSRLLVMPETTTARDRLSRNAAVFEAALPLRGSAMRRWLRDPQGPCAGIQLLRISNPRGGMQRPGGSHRVRSPRTVPERPIPSVGTTRELGQADERSRRSTRSVT